MLKLAIPNCPVCNSDAVGITHALVLVATYTRDNEGTLYPTGKAVVDWSKQSPMRTKDNAVEAHDLLQHRWFTKTIEVAN